MLLLFLFFSGGVEGGGYSIIYITPLELCVSELDYPRSMRACLRAASVI